ncbi:MAG: hypothetical protein IPI76_13270 [Chloracidobacterium sp.]|nr:hypothetical protein [Chloracidobacterium sp.]
MTLTRASDLIRHVMRQMLANNSNYALLAVSDQNAVDHTEANVFAQPTQLMPARTSTGGTPTDAKTEVLTPEVSQITSGVLSSERPHSVSSAGSANGVAMDTPKMRGGLVATAAVVMLATIGIATAGAYIYDPAIFGSGGVRTIQSKH